MKNKAFGKRKNASKNSVNLNNKKHRDNKTLKAKSVLAKNYDINQKEKEINHEDHPSSLRKALQIIKNIVLGIVVVLLGIILISFIIVKFSGGTPTVFGYSIQRISSGSMEPALNVGDIILSKTVDDPESIHVDDIVTYSGGSQFDYSSVTHRVVTQPTKNAEGIYVLVTKGDANADADPEIPFTDVKFVMIRKLDFMVTFYNFFLSPWGLITFIAALLAIFFDELLTVVKVMSGNYNEEEDESLKEIIDRLKREEAEAKSVQAQNDPDSNKGHNVFEDNKKTSDEHKKK